MRVELAEGTGHGARITLTVTGTDPAERDAAAEMWGTGAIGHLAAMAAEWASPNRSTPDRAPATQRRRRSRCCSTSVVGAHAAQPSVIAARSGRLPTARSSISTAA